MLLREGLIGNMIPVIFIHKGYQPYLEFTLKKKIQILVNLQQDLTETYVILELNQYLNGKVLNF